MKNKLLKIIIILLISPFLWAIEPSNSIIKGQIIQTGQIPAGLSKSQWQGIQKNPSETSIPTDNFANIVSLSGNTLAIAGVKESPDSKINAGAVYIYIN